MSLKEASTITLLTVVVLTNMGCSDGDVGIGSDSAAEAKTGLAAYAGTWDGYVEALTFEDGTSDRVRLFLDDQGHGTLRFGDRDLIAKPTAPNLKYYPPQAEMFGGDYAFSMSFEGFEYPLRDSKLEAARIRSSTSSFEIKRDFCAVLAAYPYRIAAGQDFNSSWEVGYSRTPVTFAGIDRSNDTCTIALFDTAPVTLEQLASNPMHRLPCADVGSGFEDERAAYNLAHPDHPMTLDTPMPSRCEGDGTGKGRLSAEAADRRDIKIDAALDNGNQLLSGSLTLPAGPNDTDTGSLVRNLRLTRL